ncbi:MAG: DUF1822 family protein [Phormidium sp.]
MNNTEIPLITVPLGREFHTQARELAARAMQLTNLADKHQIGKRVYLNTLAVYAVDSYLRWQGYEPNFSQSDSADPILCSRWDVADLMIPGIGKLECRPIWEGETVFVVPSEAIEDRIGYFAVQFGEHLDRAKLLGFIPSVNLSGSLSEIQLKDLQSLDNLIEHLYRLELGNEFLKGDDPVAVQVRQILETREVSEIIAQLERIYRTTAQLKWRYAGADVLTNSVAVAANDRENQAEFDKIQLQKLAKHLLDKLAQLWENNP